MEYFQALIRGRVQGVGFRFHARRTALSLKLEGWVRNLPDGSVETRAEGAIESLNAYLKWLHQGPPSGHVDQVEVTQRGTCRSSSGPFEIR